jgi:hypothetical protein
MSKCRCSSRHDCADGTVIRCPRSRSAIVVGIVTVDRPVMAPVAESVAVTVNGGFPPREPLRNDRCGDRNLDGAVPIGSGDDERSGTDPVAAAASRRACRVGVNVQSPRCSSGSRCRATSRAVR